VEARRRQNRSNPWRVFLSHTSELRDYPRRGSFVAAAETAVHRAGNAITDMAYFAAREQQPSEYCRQMVSQADVFVGIVGFRYGTPVSDREDVSYTELELRIATEFGIPRLIFVLDEDAELTLPPRHIIDLEYGARQMAFRRRLRGEPGPTLAVVASPAELETRLYQALMELTIDAGGLTSYELTDVVGAPVAAPLGRLPAEVRGRDELLGMLRERRGFVVLTGMGGVGKSTAAAAVARQLRSDRDRDVWWVSAADVTSLAGGIVTVARSLGADDRNLTVLARQTGDGPDRFWKLLDQAPNGWLLGTIQVGRGACRRREGRFGCVGGRQRRGRRGR
jgi:hypothetical protein